MIYLDNAATTPVNSEVAQVIADSLKSDFANPSSLYKIGAQSENKINTARRTVAGFINAKEDEIDVIVDRIDNKKILWEAPNKDQQVFFILKFGNTVNLGNVSSDDITSLETLRRGLRGDTLGKI